jgi:hypothetical protein
LTQTASFEREDVMRRRIKAAAIVIGTLAIAIQFIRPARTNPMSPPEASLAARLHVPDDAARVLDRACRDCHSNGTRWPWYSQIAPVSWFVIDHVNHGRSHFNYSTWASYDRDEARKLLEGSCELAEAGKMPLGSYLIMHGHARLSSTDVETLCRWTREARATIAARR